MLEFTFILFLVMTIYSYFLYPFVLKVLELFMSEKASAVELPPLTHEQGDLQVSLIITAYNEQTRIREKIENALEIEYPKTQMEVIVASDGSEDETDDIVREYLQQGVRLVRTDERLGKENAQLSAIKQAKGQVLVFSDVATVIPSDAITKMLEYFTDATVGAVSSEDRFINSDGKVSGEGAYVKYEMWLRSKESKVAGLVGLSGSFFAVRKTICSDWDISSPSDFNSALNCAKSGVRAVTAPDVLGFYKDLKDPSKEYQRKVRTVLRGITGLMRHTEVLNVFQFGAFAIQVWSHKVMRWMMPWFMLICLVLNALVIGHHTIYGIMFLAQLLFYVAALGGHYSDNLRENGLVRLVYFFVQVNVAIAHASLLYISGKRMLVWQPSAR